MKEYEFSEAETARIRAALETWASYGVSADRRWLEPLLVAMFSADARC